MFSFILVTGLFNWQVGSTLQKSASLIPFNKIRRQDIPSEMIATTKEGGKFGHTYGSYRYLIFTVKQNIYKEECNFKVHTSAYQVTTIRNFFNSF